MDREPHRTSDWLLAGRERLTSPLAATHHILSLRATDEIIW